MGVPIELPVAIDTSTPFPCQHHRCGCASASQCWQQCCCYTEEEKLAWAHAHGVVPPEHLVAKARPQTPANGPRACHDSSRTCSHAKTSHLPATDTQACHHKTTAAGMSPKLVAKATAKPATARRVAHASTCGNCRSQSKPAATSITIVKALECQALASYWVSIGAVAPPPPPLCWQFDWSCRGSIPATIEHPPLLCDAPPTPPPRI
jgi:hypothetical protein